MWPWTQKSRLSILLEVDDKENKAKEDNSDIFTRKNFRAHFIANADSLFIIILSII